jgi:hypothetical protein
MTSTWLSPSVGIPIALVSMSLWFFVEVLAIRGRRRPVLLLPSAVLVTAVLLAIVVTRFVKYT